MVSLMFVLTVAFPLEAHNSEMPPAATAFAGFPGCWALSSGCSMPIATVAALNAILLALWVGLITKCMADTW